MNAAIDVASTRVVHQLGQARHGYVAYVSLMLFHADFQGKTESGANRTFPNPAALTWVLKWLSDASCPTNRVKWSHHSKVTASTCRTLGIEDLVGCESARLKSPSY